MSGRSHADDVRFSRSLLIKGTSHCIECKQNPHHPILDNHSHHSYVGLSNVMKSHGYREMIAAVAQPRDGAKIEIL